VVGQRLSPPVEYNLWGLTRRLDVDLQRHGATR